MELNGTQTGQLLLRRRRKDGDAGPVGHNSCSPCQHNTYATRTGNNARKPTGRNINEQNKQPT
eukprot:5360153-Lingulodinium_polyedra.AAC.1